MKRLRLIGMQAERESLLRLLQHMGCVEIDEPPHLGDDPEWAALTRPDPGALNAARDARARVEGALKTLKKYGPKQKGGLLKPRPVVTEEELFDDAAYEAGLADAGRLGELERRITALYAEQNKLRTQRLALAPWLALDIPLETASTPEVAGSFGTVAASADLDALERELAEKSELTQVLRAGADTQLQYLVFLCHRSAEEACQEVLKEYGFSRAALRGGTTTVIDFACPNKGESLQYGLDLWHKKADGRTFCDYGFHMTIDDWNPQIEAEIDDMYAAGISSFKMYMTYPAMMIGDNAMYHALKKLKEKGGICGVHCENSGVIDALIEEKKAAGEMGVSSHPRTRPDFLEAEAVSRLLRIAEAVDIPVVIVHLTNAAALREVEAARKRGQKVYAETCPQYLLLDDSVYDNPDYSLAARYVCAPPIRKTEDQKALWMALRRGEIQTISTDHCSFTLAQKDAGRGDFTKIPGGLPGVETRGELIYTAGVTTRKISLATMCRVLAENPAKLYGMFPRKGILQAGADADIVVYDPLADHVIRAADMVANVDYNPYEGFTTRGSIQQVWLRGRLAVEHGTVLAGTDGKYILRGKNCL